MPAPEQYRIIVIAGAVAPEQAFRASGLYRQLGNGALMRNADDLRGLGKGAIVLILREAAINPQSHVADMLDYIKDRGGTVVCL